jgi:hypothetical protein
MAPHSQMLKTLLMTAAVSAILYPAASSAQAIDGEDFATKLTAALGPTDMALSYGNAEVSGDVVTLSDVTLDNRDGDDIELGSVIFEGVAGEDDGGYTVREAIFPDIDVSEDDIRFTARDMTLSGIDIPGEADPNDPIEGILFYQQARVGPLAVTFQDEPAFSLNETVIDVARRSDGSGIDTMMRLEGMTANLAQVEDQRSRDVIEAMDLEEVTGRMNISAGWDIESGEIDISDYAIELDDIGRLVLMFSFSGYTPEFATALQETQSNLAENGDDEMAGIAVLGLVQQLSFNSASIRFEDSSITRRVLNYIGEQQGVDGDQMAQAVKGMLPLMLAQLQNPEFQRQISQAVGAFLDDPQSLTIETNPEEPVPFMEIIAAGSSAPQTLPEVLELEVRAND